MSKELYALTTTAPKRKILNSDQATPNTSGGTGYSDLDDVARLVPTGTAITGAVNVLADEGAGMRRRSLDVRAQVAAIPDATDPPEQLSLEDGDKVIVVDAASGAAVKKILHVANGGLYTSFDAPSPPSHTLAAGVPEILTDWDGAFSDPVNVTTNAAAGTITVGIDGIYTITAGVTIEYDVTDRMAVSFFVNGVLSIGNSGTGFRDKGVDVQNVGLFFVGQLSAGDVISIRVEAVAVGGPMTQMAGHFFVRRSV